MVIHIKIISEGFAVNEILPKERVIAGAGAIPGFTYDALCFGRKESLYHVGIE
ncbi:hypothetical protein [Desulfosporosinus hippei]|uniref:hypothetical protein n=1 Tax=Desulfosporosinus hippei TaxID=569859 RepID=UPI0031F35FA2